MARAPAFNRIGDDVITPGSTLVKNADFSFQSFFDTTQLGQALLVQPPNELIVPKTSLSVPVPCYGAALHPDSQVPVAVKFKANLGSEESTTYFLTPGQVIHPHEAPFTGLTWGLPFGWLGGGSAQLVIFKTPTAEVTWPRNKVEVVIQRQRVAIQADGAAPTFSFGLPLRFPWRNAQRFNAASTTTPFQQPGLPVIAVEPTRTLFKLRVNPLANPSTIRMLVKNSESFDESGVISSAGVPTLSGDVEAVTVSFPATAGAAAYFPVAEVQLPDVLLAGDNATFALLNDPANPVTLAAALVDIVRFGRI